MQEADNTLDDLMAARPDAVMIHSATEIHATVSRASDYADILATHQLCERVVTQIIGAD